MDSKRKTVTLSIIILTYNSAGSIKECLDAIFKKIPPNSEVIVVDNNSEDETIKLLKEYPLVKLILNDENRGFASGCNLGAKYAVGEYLLFLNPDTKVKDEAISKMLDLIKGDDSIGLVAPQLTTDGKVQSSIRKLPTIGGVIKEYLLGKKHAYSEYYVDTKHPVEVEAVYGAAMMLNKQVFEQIKGFNEKYFLYYEDLDLCKKVRSLGLKIIYLPTAQIAHRVGYSTTRGKILPFGIRTLSHFVPLKASGSYYYQVQGGYLYHGLIIGFMIRVLLYFIQKIK